MNCPWVVFGFMRMMDFYLQNLQKLLCNVLLHYNAGMASGVHAAADQAVKIERAGIF